MTLLAAVAGLAAAATPTYATPEAAMERAVREATASLSPRVRSGTRQIECIGAGDVGERGTCHGFFELRRGGRRMFYVLTVRSRVQRTSASAVTARLDATRDRLARGFPERLEADATASGPPRPAERTVHGDLVLDRSDDFRDQTLSRRTRLAFPMPWWWQQAYDEGPVTVSGAVDVAYDIPPGGACYVEIGLSPRLARDPPVERDGRLGGWSRYHEPGSDDAERILTRAEDGAGTTTWTLRGGYTVRAGPAPAGAGPPELDTLIVVAYVTRELSRYGSPGRDGIPLLRPSGAQRARCRALAERARATVVPRALDAARLVARARPPRADPEDEVPTPVDRDF